MPILIARRKNAPGALSNLKILPGLKILLSGERKKLELIYHMPIWFKATFNITIDMGAKDTAHNTLMQSLH